MTDRLSIDIESQLANSLSDGDLSVSSDEYEPNLNNIKYQKFLFKNFYIIIILVFLFSQILNSDENSEKYFSILIFIVFYVSKMNLKKKKTKKDKE